MSVVDLESSVSDLLQREITSIERSRGDLCSKLERATSVRDYYHSFIASVYGLELQRRIADKGKQLKVLDIGFGRGETSLYLASMGHEVHALEPSPLNCEVLSRASQKFNTPLQIYQGTAEGLNNISEKDFDLCLFNSSLHHCDDPMKALQNCLQKLLFTGRLLVINEPILKFFRTKKWFHKKLLNDPVSLGHYGGNEHIYYYHEYVQMIKKAGFTHVKTFNHIRCNYPRETIQVDMEKKIQDQYVNSDTKILVKFFVLWMLKQALQKERGLFSKYFKWLSLIPVSFEASR